MTNLRAAIGVAQVEKLSGFLERQRHRAARAARRPPGSSSSSPMLLGEELFWLSSVFLADNRVTRDQA
jgi:dTDP-4-amino-4,6-dideoxygalactose transaminase